MGVFIIAACARSVPKTVSEEQEEQIEIQVVDFGRSFHKFIFIGDRYNLPGPSGYRVDFASDDDLKFIANHEYVFLAKFHGGFDRNAQHSAAYALKKYAHSTYDDNVNGVDTDNNDIPIPKVFPYIAMRMRIGGDILQNGDNPTPSSLHFRVENDYFGTSSPPLDKYNTNDVEDGFQDSWLLRVPDDRIPILRDCDGDPNIDTEPTLCGDEDSEPDKVPFISEATRGAEDAPDSYYINLIGQNGCGIDPVDSMHTTLYQGNGAYATWLRLVIRNWMQKTSTGFPLYDGIYFDSSPYLGLGNDEVYGVNERERWRKIFDGASGDTVYKKLIGKDDPGVIGCWNRGIELRLASIKHLFKVTLGNPNLEVIWNGIAKWQRTPNSRSTGLLEFSDGAFNERFCINPEESATSIYPSSTDLIKEIDLLYTLSADRKIFEKVNYNKAETKDANGNVTSTAVQNTQALYNDVDRVNKLANFCLGVFAMGINDPQDSNGKIISQNAFFHFNSGYSASYNSLNPTQNLPFPGWKYETPEMDLMWGNPTAAYQATTDPGTTNKTGILVRKFQGGLIAVNLESTSSPLGDCNIVNSVDTCYIGTLADSSRVIQGYSMRRFVNQ